MDKLRAKIEKTSLFSEGAKVHLIAHLSELPSDEQKRLEATIDEFEARVKELGTRLRKDINEQISSLAAEASVDEKKDVDDASEVVKTGLDVLTGTP